MRDSIVARPESPTSISVRRASKDSPMMGIDVVFVKYLFCPSIALLVASSLFFVTDNGMKRPFFSGIKPLLLDRVRNFTKHFCTEASHRRMSARVVSLLYVMLFLQ